MTPKPHSRTLPNSLLPSYAFAAPYSIRERSDPMRARIFPDYEAMSAAAADAVARRVGHDPSSVLLLPTGTTPLGMYRRLVDHVSSG